MIFLWDTSRREAFPLFTLRCGPSCFSTTNHKPHANNHGLAGHDELCLFFPAYLCIKHTVKTRPMHTPPLPICEYTCPMQVSLERHYKSSVQSYQEPPQNQRMKSVCPTNTILIVTGTPANQIGPQSENYSHSSSNINYTTSEIWH